MNWRTLRFDYADPDLPMTFRQRVQLLFGRTGHRKLPQDMRRSRMLAGILTLPMAPMPAVVCFTVLPPVPDIAQILVFLALFAAFWIWLALVYGWLCRREIYYRIRLAGHDVCLCCGYWLRKLPDDVTNCPECGAERTSTLEDRS